MRTSRSEPVTPPWAVAMVPFATKVWQREQNFWKIFLPATGSPGLAVFCAGALLAKVSARAAVRAVIA